MKRGTVNGRTDRDGPIRVVAEVVTRRRTGPYTTLAIATQELAARSNPGHFVEVAVEAPGTLLRRPLSIARADAAASGVGIVELVIGPDGPGSAWLAEVQAGSHLDLIGPLGRPFPLPQRPARCLLVGGGYGAAPLHYLAEVLVPLGHRVDLIVGASTESTLLHSIEAKRVAHSLQTTTEDGSAGMRGRVTDAIPDVVARHGSDVIYACGPNAMLAAVSVLGGQLGVPVRVSLEERMACGLGVCFTCAIPVRDRDGEVQMRRSCIDGPVMDGSRVDWRLMGLGHVVDAMGGGADATGSADASGREVVA
ncbi:MAG: dihydroorotate dehydrogenase electron transfer subunit [Actinomycetota bacterium]|nr:dihydroorotate dehydrogenase electron transfer subunit [Actinomycetota bacterium]